MPLTDFSGRLLINPLTQSFTPIGGLKRSLSVFDKVIVEMVPFAGDWKSCVHFEKDGRVLSDAEASALLSTVPVKENRVQQDAVLLEKANRHLEEIRAHLLVFQKVLGVEDREIKLPSGPLTSLAELETQDPKLVPALKMNRSQFRVLVKEVQAALSPGVTPGDPKTTTSASSGTGSDTGGAKGKEESKTKGSDHEKDPKPGSIHS